MVTLYNIELNKKKMKICIIVANGTNECKTENIITDIMADIDELPFLWGSLSQRMKTGLIIAEFKNPNLNLYRILYRFIGPISKRNRQKKMVWKLIENKGHINCSYKYKCQIFICFAF